MPIIEVTDRNGTARRVEAEEGLTLMEALRELDYPIEATCGGCCSCATCHVYITDPAASGIGPASGGELELLEETGIARPGQSRLACQIEVTGALDGIALEIAPD